MTWYGSPKTDTLTLNLSAYSNAYGYLCIDMRKTKGGKYSFLLGIKILNFKF